VADDVAAGEDGVGRHGVGLGVQEVVEHAQGGQPPVDGGYGVAELAAVVDVGVHVVQGDGGRGLPAQAKKSFTSLV